MKIRTRLLLGYGYLVALLLLSVGGAAVGFFELSGSIDRVLESNVVTVRASTAMLEALERQDSAVLTALLSPEPMGEEIETADAAFAEAFERANAQASADEHEMLERLERAHGAYLDARAELLRAPHDRPLAAYKERLFPSFNRVKADVLELLEHEHRAIVAADRQARETAVENGAWLGFLVALALVSLVYLTRALQRDILMRLSRLEETAEAIAAGEANRRLDAAHDDELGTLARHFNAALDHQDELRARMRGRLDEQRQLLLGLLSRPTKHAGLLGLDGRFIAASFDPTETRIVGEHREWLRTAGQKEAIAWETGTPIPTHDEPLDDGRRLHFELLTADSSRPVGWIVWFASGGGATA